MLSIQEIINTAMQRQNPIRINNVKKEWCDALETVEGVLLPGSIINRSIHYQPSVWYRSNSTAHVDQKKGYVLEFSTPNNNCPFDFYPKETKIGVMAHEALGHPADRFQYYPDNLAGVFEENKNFVSAEQRANLRVMHALPVELYEHIRQHIKSNIRCFGVEPDLGEYEIAWSAIETLGRAGLPRSDNVFEFFKRVYDETDMPVDKYLEEYPGAFLLTGLAVPPQLNVQKEYGIRTYTNLGTYRGQVIAYLYGEIKEPIGIITTYEGYNPATSVDMRWIDLEKAGEKVEKAISYWEQQNSKHNEWLYAEDMIKSLKSISNGIKNSHLGE